MPRHPWHRPARRAPYEYGYAGSYPAFQRHLRLLRPAEVRDPEIRFETGPGHPDPGRLGQAGRCAHSATQMVELSAMVAILGLSRAPAIRFAADQTRATQPSSGWSAAWTIWAG